MSTDFNKRAEELIAAGRLPEARAMLETAVREMLPDWRPRCDTGKAVVIAFWSLEEFLAFIDNQTEESDKPTFWTGDSYSRAWYQLAVIAVKGGRFEEALFCLDRGLDLEPDHPELWCEKGYVFGQLKHHPEALDCYVRAASAREWSPRSYMALALRGQGVQLIDLNRLEEAESVLKRSLEYEPDNDGARNELKYIENLRSQRKAAEEQVPWFLSAYVHPPSDPLTVRFLALVADLPSIPGPKTVGSENYSRIFKAFTTRGWPGFEEEFDRIVPRGRPDYADLKRDLLREPLFTAKVHRRLSEAFTGARTVDEICDEIFKEHERKPKPQ